ncbi:MAG: hypothetical protein Unbinned8472contig1000_33 [Prokaryotic dsDNA virus sp.]|nr:MAG: hypothetical protein Unbinned8472contig1000_33 [Prokaryotic dsDNA virus sp.]|tara:strand:- start:1801 stop:2085 length:285 start_codon:yes stop_codon:yes gene_type:complete
MRLLILALLLPYLALAEVPERFTGPLLKYELSVVVIMNSNSSNPWTEGLTSLRGLKKKECETLADMMRVSWRKDRLAKDDIIITVCSRQRREDI